MNAVHTTHDSFLQWDPAQVSSFINSVRIEDDSPRLGQVFLDNNIEGSLLPFITTEHLKEIGISKLSSRLVIKKRISELISQHHDKNPPKSLQDPDYKLANINVNNNYVSFESLTLSTVLMKDMLKKLSATMHHHQSLTSSPISDQQTLDIKRLQDNFNRLKSDLIPVIRLLKDSKPLPTPTLDPGHNSSLHVDSPTYSISSNHSTNSNTLIDTLQDAGLIGNQSSSNRNSNSNPLPSPTQSNRYSSGSVLSLGTGKMIPSNQAGGSTGGGSGGGSGSGSAGGSVGGNTDSKSSRPRLVESKSTSSAVSYSGGNIKPFRKHSNLSSSNPALLSSQDGPGTGNNTVASSASSTASTIGPSPGSGPGAASAINTSTEPLKQLRASSDDSCLKILQQAMKRHHIPRNDWSKYVLVICYGDKERILKLAEKPVPIFKELQELGKHPAIMLRQLADTIEEDNDINELYEDSRIGDEIPGGTL